MDQTEHLKVAFITPEMAPLAKTGGLADVTGALPKYLSRSGQLEVTVWLPFYREIKKKNLNLKLVATNLKLDIFPAESQKNFSIFEYQTEDFKVYLVQNDFYFDRDYLYGTPEGDYPDNGHRFAFFCLAALTGFKLINWIPDLIHAHDWQSGLIPVYIKTLLREEPMFQKALTVFTIHNLGYQGKFPSMYLNMAGLPHYLFNVDALEFYGEINFLKGGVLFSDIVTTVSPRYAQEIQTKAFGEKLEGVLSIRSDALYGILNGIDYDIFDPTKTNLVPYAFTPNDLSGKARNKRLLQERLGLEVNPDVPVFGLISRLVAQKGLDILSKITPFFLMQDVQLVVLGTGDAEYEELVQEMAAENPKKVSANLKFDIDLANLIYAGSDIFLMPSRYEPCGLGQMFSLRFGTIPVVHYVGGLADSIIEFDEKEKTGNGFGFSEYRESELLLSIFRALYFYRRKESWETLIKNAMTDDFSWERSAKEYVYIYTEGLKNKRAL